MDTTIVNNFYLEYRQSSRWGWAAGEAAGVASKAWLQ
jgi:hypothetical protein